MAYEKEILQLLTEIRDAVVKKPRKTKAKDVVYTAEFEAFWQIYPRKVGKAEAAKAWAQIPANCVQWALDAIPCHAAYWRREKTQQKYIPHASHWLRKEHWTDVLPNIFVAKQGPQLEAVKCSKCGHNSGVTKYSGVWLCRKCITEGTI